MDEVAVEVTRRPAILVAEDDASVRKVIGSTLQRAGYEVVLARNSADALAVFRKVPVDLLIADVILPDLPGTALAAECSSLRPGVAVLFISGYGRDALEERGLVVDSVLEKPFNPAQLRAAVAGKLANSVSPPLSSQEASR
jgi:DNA-binding response OmpR family regulator